MVIGGAIAKLVLAPYSPALPMTKFSLGFMKRNMVFVIAIRPVK